MAEFVEKVTRGRKKSDLRVAMAGLASTLSKATGTRKVTWLIAEADGETPADTFTKSIPKGAIKVPFALTNGKSSANVGMLSRNGLKEDGGVKEAVKVESYAIKTNAGEPGLVYFVSFE